MKILLRGSSDLLQLSFKQLRKSLQFRHAKILFIATVYRHRRSLPLCCPRSNFHYFALVPSVIELLPKIYPTSPIASRVPFFIMIPVIDLDTVPTPYYPFKSQLID